MRKEKIGCLGPEGTFSEQAARKFFGEETKITLFSKNGGNGTIVEAVAEGKIKKAIVAIYNGIVGEELSSINSIIEYSNLRIIGEIIMPIEQALIVSDGNIRMQDIKRVMSHPNAIGQCRKWIRKNLPEAEIVETSSTAQAVKQISDSSESAIASVYAAGKYGKYILRNEIQDGENFTRFLAITSEKPEEQSEINGRKHITSLIVEIPNIRGSLYRILEILKEVNIDWLEVRPSKMFPPTKENPGNILFWIDIKENRETIEKTIQELKKKTRYLRILGSYPRIIENSPQWMWGDSCPVCGSSNYGTIKNEEKSAAMEIITKCRNCGFEGDTWIY